MRPTVPALIVALAASFGCTQVPGYRPPGAVEPRVPLPGRSDPRADPATVPRRPPLTPIPEPNDAIATPRLRARIDSVIRTVPGAEVAVWFRYLDTRTTLNVNADLPFHAASTMKVPVMIELFRRADAGTVSLDETIELVNKFPSIVDGSPYSLTPADDSDSSLYAKVGQRVSYRELNDRMITHSSNLATNVLIAQLDAKKVTETSRSLGASGMTVLRGVEDSKAYEKGLNNSTTARALGVLLEAIQSAKAASLESSTAMRDVLMRQTEKDEIPAGLPPGTPVAHKTGWITATRHDAAIVYTPRRRPYVLVVLTRKIPDTRAAQNLIAGISKVTWEAVISTR